MDTVDGGRLTLSGLLSPGKPVVLFFADPACSWCRSMFPEVADWRRRFDADLMIGIVSRGPLDDNLAVSRTHDLADISVPRDREVQQRYAAHATPSAVLVHADGRVWDPVAQGRDQIRRLIAWVVDGRWQERQTDAAIREYLHRLADSGPALGTAGTRLSPDVDDRYVGLDDYRGRDAVLLFWGSTAPSASACSPTCASGSGTPALRSHRC